MDDDLLSLENQTAHIKAHFASVYGVAPIEVTFTEDEEILVRVGNFNLTDPWVFNIPSDDDGNYYFRRGNVTISFPYPGE